MTEILVRDAFSRVEVTGEQRSDVEATLRVVSTGYDDAEAKRLAAATTLKIDRPGSALAFAPDAPPQGRQTVSLTMKVPSRLRIRVETPSSRVVVTNVASVEIPSGRTETTVKQVAGRATVSHRGGRLIIEDVGALKLSSRSSETTLRNVGGDASISLQGGELDASGLAGAVDVESQNADVRIDQAERVKGPVRVNATGGTISIKGLRTDARIDGRNAELQIDMAAAAPVVVYNDGDEAIELAVPAGGFVLDAMAINGRITADVVKDLGLEITAADDAKEQRASGRVRGGGPTITLRSNGGDIRLSTR
jgi:hypothetical protein